MPARLRSPELEPGDTLAGYRVEQLLGRGGMGVVYRATQLSLQRLVALKLLAPELCLDVGFRERFGREARLAASLEHPSVLPVYEAGEVEGLLYLALRYIEGQNLDELLEQAGPLEPGRALALVSQVASALDAAHARGLLHRDVKPANVLLEVRAEGEHAYLADFGLARSSASVSRLTATGTFLGTVDYVSPEQIRGEPVDHRSDLYALACLVFELLAGRPPFRHQDEVATLWAHMHDQPPALSGLRPELPAALDSVLARALAKQPEERYTSGRELVQALQHALAGERTKLAPAQPLPPAGNETAPPGAIQPSTRVARRTVTVLLAELRVVYADGQPADLEIAPQVRVHAVEAAKRIVAQHGGTFEPALGDLVLGVFGVPIVHEDDAFRAVRAAAHLKAAIADLNEQRAKGWRVCMELRASVTTGEVMTGANLGSASGGLATAAAPLQQAAGAADVVLAAETYLLVRDRVHAKPIPTQSGVSAWSLVEVHEPGSQTARRLDAPIVGRTKEQARMRQAFEQAVADSACHLFTLLGPAGVGKSRLAEQFLADAVGGSTVLRSRCLSYGEGITFWPLLEILRQALDLRDGESSIETLSGLETLLIGEPDAGLIANRLAQLVGLTEGATTSEEGFWAVRKLFNALARQRPLVVAFDDLHWAEPTFLDLVEHLADWSRDEPIFLLCLARPELLDARPAWAGGKLNTTSVLLEPLGEDAASDLIDNLIGRGSLPEGVRRRITEAAEGNPLFVEEMLAMLIDDGSLRKENRHWSMARDLSSLSIPPTVRAVLAARLDRLPATELRVIECASIEGKIFHRGAVDALMHGDSRSQLAGHLMRLVRKELVRPDRAEISGDDAFRFRHILVRDAAYQTISKQARAELHERFALWLENAAGDRTTEYQEILGYHLEQAFRYRNELGPLDEEGRALGARAGGHLVSAGRRALSRDDLSAASNLLERAIALLPDEETARIEVMLELGEALRATGELERAKGTLSEALKAAVEAGDERLETQALIDGLVLQTLSDPDFDTGELLRAAEEAIQVLERHGDDLGLTKAWRAVAEAHLTTCKWRASTQALERALEHSRRGAGQKEITATLTFLANSLYWGPTPASEGVRRCEEILLEVSGHRTDEANVLSYLAGFEAMLGHLPRARALLARGRAIFEELGHKYGIGAHSLVAGPVALLAGDAARAEQELLAGYRLFEEMGETGVLSSLAAFLAEAVYRQGKLEEAERYAIVARQTSTSDDAASQIGWRVALAKVLARRGNTEEAERLAREAVERARQTDFINIQADVQVDLGEVLRLAGRELEAVEAIEEASRLYAMKENQPALDRANGFLLDLRRR